MKAMEKPKKELEGTIDVLLVDDDTELRGALARGLKRKGFQVSVAATANDALRLMADAGVPIDVVVMDIVLPDSWGSQVAMEQSLYRPGTPVIFISGHTPEDAVLEASSAQGEIHFLAKPFSVDELAAAIRLVVAGEGRGDES
jgi:two-component system cell cycle sensor histidine kinase/response regulator CckA